MNWKFIETSGNYDYYSKGRGKNKIYNCCKKGEAFPDDLDSGYYSLDRIKKLKTVSLWNVKVAVVKWG